MIWTNTVQVTGHLGYELGLLTCNDTTPVVNSTISFTGTLLYDGQGISDKWVILYNSTDQTSWTEFAQARTNSTGYYQASYVFPIVGSMYFKGGFTS